MYLFISIDFFKILNLKKILFFPEQLMSAALMTGLVLNACQFQVSVFLSRTFDLMETDIELIPPLLGDFKSNLINPKRNQFLMDTFFIKENIYLICEWWRLKTFDRKCEKNK